jgi:hypothetical protein
LCAGFLRDIPVFAVAGVFDLHFPASASIWAAPAGTGHGPDIDI